MIAYGPELVALLEADPRASVREMASQLGISRAVLQRDLDHLTQSGLLRVTIARPTPQGALPVLWMLDVLPAAREAVAQALASVPSVGGASRVAGSRSFTLESTVDGWDGIARFEERVIAPLQGVQSATPLVVRESVKSRSRNLWAARHPGTPARATGRRLSPELERHLAEDGRIGWTELAGRLGEPATTVRDRVLAAEAAGEFRWVVVAHPTVAGRQAQAFLGLSCAPGDEAALAARLAAEDVAWTVLTTTGPWNVLAFLVGSDGAALFQLQERLPEARSAEWWPVIRPLRRGGLVTATPVAAGTTATGEPALPETASR